MNTWLIKSLLGISVPYQINAVLKKVINGFIFYLIRKCLINYSPLIGEKIVTMSDICNASQLTKPEH